MAYSIKTTNKVASDILNKIVIKKPKPDRVLYAGRSAEKLQRSLFDPRAMYDRNKLLISKVDCDILADATNGNCGIVLLLRSRNVTGTDLSVSNFVEVETSKRVEMPKSIEKYVGQVNSNHNLISLSDKMQALLNIVTITKDEAVLVLNETINQSCNEEWFNQRRNRITASKFKLIANKADDSLTVIRESRVAFYSSISHFVFLHSMLLKVLKYALT